MQGIAVTAADGTNGVWQYSTNGGGSWTAFGTPSATAALLLAADADTRVRFVPDADWSGTVADGMTFRAWDQTSGTAGSYVDTTVNGGTTAFSSATATAGIAVLWVDQPPQGTSSTVTLAENSSYSFQVSDFGFSDPNDPPPNGPSQFVAVEITTLPAAGTLTDNGTPVTAGQSSPPPTSRPGTWSSPRRRMPLERATPASPSRSRTTAARPTAAQDLDPVPKTMTVTVTPVGYVMGRYIAYYDSSWDDDSTTPGPQDDSAIAPDKQALLPGQTASFANYTSYSQGINCIMIDLENPGNAAAINPADFQFRVGNDDNPSAWTAAPAPSQITSWTLANGLTRVEIVWPDHDAFSLLPQPQTIANEWLQVVVLATADTNLLEPDVFYFGNAIGETGNSTTNAYVNATDAIGARMNPASYSDPASITDPYDFDRDQRVDATDEIIARDNPTAYGTALNLISVPLQVNLSAAPDGVPAGVARRRRLSAGPGRQSGDCRSDLQRHRAQPGGDAGRNGAGHGLGRAPLALSYAITAGDPNGVFAIDPATGQITVANMLLLDYCRQSTYNLTVQVSDNGDPSQSATGVVTVNLIEVTPVISVGAISLLPNTPDQVCQIMVSGGAYVAGLTLNISVGDGLDAGTAPRITGVDILGNAADPTIFYGNNTGQVDANGVPDPYPEYETVQTTTGSGLVPANGLLADVTIDTTGFTSGTWALVLADPAGVATDFAGKSAVINNGTITIVQAPLTATWSGGGANANWSTAANWGGAALAAGAGLQFAGTTGLDSQNDMPPGLQVNGMTFASDAGAFVLSGNALNLGGGIVNNSAATQTIALPLALAGDQTLDAAAGNLQVSGDISGQYGIITAGAGTVVLSGANRYSGGTTVAAGTLEITQLRCTALGRQPGRRRGCRPFVRRWGCPKREHESTPSRRRSPKRQPGCCSHRGSRREPAYGFRRCLERGGRRVGSTGKLHFAGPEGDCSPRNPGLVGSGAARRLEGGGRSAGSSGCLAEARTGVPRSG